MDPSGKRMNWKIAAVALIITGVLVAAARASVPESTVTFLPTTIREVTKKGPVYIHIPPDRDPKAGVLIYVHGHRSDFTTKWYVDSVWNKHDLPGKFDASKSKAVLVAVASWDGKKKGVSWPDLDVLVTKLERQLGPIPYVHAMGHSGAWKNLSQWSRSARLDHLTLLDSTYGGLKDFRNFGKVKRMDIAVGKWGKPRSNAKVVLKGLQFCAVRLKNVASSKCRVIAVEEKIRHSNWAIDNAMIEFMARGAVLRASDP